MRSLVYCSSFPAFLGRDSGRGNTSSFSIQLEVYLVAAERVTSKSQGDTPGGDQHQEKAQYLSYGSAAQLLMLGEDSD